MTEQEVRNKILEIFNSKRSSSLANFNDAYFMDFLTNPAHKKNTLKNSFRGARKYYSFMDELELEFGICFSFSDLDKYYSIDKLTKKVLQRIKKGKGNKMILQRRNEEKETYIIELILLILLAGLFYWQGVSLFSILVTIIFGIIIYWILSSKVNNKRHLQKMNKKLMMTK